MALDMAVNRHFPAVARGQDVSLMSDNSWQPAVTAFMKACSTLGIHQAVTRENNPKGHADAEPSMCTLKEEGLWLWGWASPWELGEALEA